MKIRNTFILGLLSVLISLNLHAQNENDLLLPFDAYLIGYDNEVSSQGDFLLVIKTRVPIPTGVSLGITNAHYSNLNGSDYWSGVDDRNISRFDFKNIGPDIPSNSTLIIESDYRNSQNPVHVFFENESTAHRFEVSYSHFETSTNTFFNPSLSRLFLYQGTWYTDENGSSRLLGTVVDGLWITSDQINPLYSIPKELRDKDIFVNTNGSSAAMRDIAQDQCCEEDKDIKDGFVWDLPPRPTTGADIDPLAGPSKDNCCPDFELEIVQSQNCRIGLSEHPCPNNRTSSYAWTLISGTHQDPLPSGTGTNLNHISFTGITGNVYQLEIICNDTCTYTQTYTVDCGDCTASYLLSELDCVYSVEVFDCNPTSIAWYKYFDNGSGSGWVGQGSTFVPTLDGDYYVQVNGCQGCPSLPPQDFTVDCVGNCEFCDSISFYTTIRGCSLEWDECLGWNAILYGPDGNQLATTPSYSPTQNGGYTLVFSNPNCPDTTLQTFVSCVEDPCETCPNLGLFADQDACELSWESCSGWATSLEDPNGNHVATTSPYNYSIDGIYILSYSKTGCDSILDSIDVVCNSSCENTDIDVVVTANPVIVLCGNSSQLETSVTGGTGPYQYEWNHDPSVTISNPIVSPSSTAIYRVTVTDQNGCDDNNYVQVQVQNDCTLCPVDVDVNCHDGYPISVSASAQCSPGAFSNNAYTTLKVEYFPSGNLCPYTYEVLYEQTSGPIDAFWFDPNFTYECGTVKATWGGSLCCPPIQGSTTINCCQTNLEIVESPDCTLSANVTGCANPQYTWSSGETSQQITVNTDGTHSVTVTGCCQNLTDNIEIEDCECFCIVQSINNQETCVEDPPISIQALTDCSNGGFQTLEWYQDYGTPSSTLIGTGTLISYYNAVPGTYIITVVPVNPANNCTPINTTFTIEVTDCDQCEANAYIDGPTNINCNTLTTFDAIYTAPGGCNQLSVLADFAIYKGGSVNPDGCGVSGGVLINPTSVTDCSVSHAFTENGQYHIILDLFDNEDNCSYCDPHTIEVTGCSDCDCVIDLDYDEDNCQIIYSATGCSSWQLRKLNPNCQDVEVVASNIDLGPEVINAVFDIEAEDACGQSFNLLGSEIGCGIQITPCQQTSCCEDCVECTYVLTLEDPESGSVEEYNNLFVEYPSSGSEIHYEYRKKVTKTCSDGSVEIVLDEIKSAPRLHKPSIRTSNFMDFPIISMDFFEAGTVAIPSSITNEDELVDYLNSNNFGAEYFLTSAGRARYFADPNNSDGFDFVDGVVVASNGSFPYHSAPSAATIALTDTYVTPCGTLEYKIFITDNFDIDDVLPDYLSYQLLGDEKVLFSSYYGDHNPDCTTECPESQPRTPGSAQKGTSDKYDQGQQATYWIYPNPASNSFTLEYRNSTNRAKLNLEILDVSGRSMQSQDYPLDSGLNVFRVETTTLVSGVYLARITTEGQEYLERLIIIKN